MCLIPAAASRGRASIGFWSCQNRVLSDGCATQIQVPPSEPSIRQARRGTGVLNRKSGPNRSTVADVYILSVDTADIASAFCEERVAAAERTMIAPHVRLSVTPTRSRPRRRARRADRGRRPVGRLFRQLRRSAGFLGPRRGVGANGDEDRCRLCSDTAASSRRAPPRQGVSLQRHRHARGVRDSSIRS